MIELHKQIRTACEKAALEYELDDRATEWAKGIASENARLLPFIIALLEANEELEKALGFYANGAERVVEASDKKHYIQEFGCGCCAQSYDVKENGERGLMNCEVDNIQGMCARETIAANRERLESLIK